MSRHVIETLNWCCDGDDARAAFAQQQRVSGFLHGPGARMLDALFDRLSPDDEYWCIDQLVVDLGDITAMADDESIARRLEEVLQAELLRWRHDSPPGGLAAPVLRQPRSQDERDLEHFLFYLQYGRLHWSMPAPADGGMADWLERLAQRTGPRFWGMLRRLPQPDRSLRRLSQVAPCHGLQALLALRHVELAGAMNVLDEALLEPLRAHGRLSAYQIAQVRQAWRVAGLHALWSESGSVLSVARVQRLLTTLGTALVAQLGEGRTGDAATWPAGQPGPVGASELVRSLLAGIQARLLGHAATRDQGNVEARTWTDADVPEHGSIERPLMLDAAWHESLRQFALAHRSAPVVRAAGLGLSELQAYLFDYTLAYLSTVDRVPQDHVAWRTVWLGALEALDAGDLPASLPDLAVDGRGPGGAAAKAERPVIRNSRNSDGTISPADDHPDNEGIYIVNAGLVLLANYTPRLFAMLELVQDQTFVSEAARHRAIHCLTYLADGDTRSEEHEWVLNKLLCDVPIEDVVPPVALSEATCSTLDNLLSAVIAHWSALGHTTPAGLRQTFLRRLGRLGEHETHEGGHWRLKVQPGPFDLLLDRLPWGYGTIKLPWMRGAIHVDWR